MNHFLHNTFDAGNWGAVPFHFWTLVFFVFGTIVGSFLNVCIHRLPLGESIVSPKSHCPHCKYSIPWYLNIPIATWIWVRGRCRNCGEPISARYFAVELLTGLMFLSIAELRHFLPGKEIGHMEVQHTLYVYFMVLPLWRIPVPTIYSLPSCNKINISAHLRASACIRGTQGNRVMRLGLSAGRPIHAAEYYADLRSTPNVMTLRSTGVDRQ